MNKKYAIIFVVSLIALAFLWQSTHKSISKSASIREYTSNVPEDVKKDAVVKLSNVEIASVYESVTDGAYYFNRSIENVSRILGETNTDLIFRGWLRWKPAPESPSEPIGFFTKEEIENNAKWGYTYEQLKEAITEIKRDNPDIIFTGAILPIISVNERNPVTGESFDRDQTWAMALDAEKWSAGISKEDLQCILIGTTYSEYKINCPKDFDRSKTPIYYPDITNSNFQELLLSWAKKQIDAGVDALWIDLLYTQADMFEDYARKHPFKSKAARDASKESFEAASKIVDEIHAYGYSKGKYIYVGTWNDFVYYPYAQPNIDFVTVTPQPAEIVSKKLDSGKWDEKVSNIKGKLGNVPIFAFIDWSYEDNRPLAVFSQNLSKDEQKNFLITADKFFQEKGIMFAYPVHGGSIGPNAKQLAYGGWKVYDTWQTYDSLAQEFETYETIRELSRIKE